MAERETVIQPDRVADDLGRETVASERRSSCGAGGHEADPTLPTTSTCQCPWPLCGNGSWRLRCGRERAPKSPYNANSVEVGTPGCEAEFAGRQAPWPGKAFQQ